jgi:hypothetical protein
VARGRSCQRPRVAGSGSSWWPRYDVTSVCGLWREMEDAVSIRLDFLHDGGVSSSSGKHHFFGVFDSHGCCHVCVRLASAVIRSSPPRFSSISPFPCARSNLACLCLSADPLCDEVPAQRRGARAQGDRQPRGTARDLFTLIFFLRCCLLVRNTDGC